MRHYVAERFYNKKIIKQRNRLALILIIVSIALIVKLIV
jgi:hypothetical protein